MTPFKHAQSSAAKWGGTPECYIHLHNWFDDTKKYTGDWSHRALRHHAAGIAEAVEKFGDSITNSKGQQIPTRMLAEQHVTEDCGFIPTVQDWLRPLFKNPEAWMLKVKTTKVFSMEELDSEDPSPDRKPVLAPDHTFADLLASTRQG